MAPLGFPHGFFSERRMKSSLKSSSGIGIILLFIVAGCMGFMAAKTALSQDSLTIMAGESQDYVWGSACAEFTGKETINFNSEPDITNVARATLHIDSIARVVWYNSVNASGADFDTNVDFGPGFVYINSAGLNPSFNNSANVTLYNLPWFETPAIFEDGSPCLDCPVNFYSSGALSFNVTHFSNYSAGSNTNLSIWDQADPEGGSVTAYTGNNITFYANYTNITSGEGISGASCNISFNVTPHGPEEMYWNSSSEEYNFNRTFSSAGAVSWNVTCNATGYEELNTTDDITINQPVTANLNYPVDSNDTINFTSVVFNCSATGGSLANISLYSDYNSSWQLIETKELTGTSNSTEFTRNIYQDAGLNGIAFLDDGFIWNCQAFNSSGGSDWGDSNFTFSSWGLGTYNNVTVNETWVELSGTNSSGNYTSQIFDAGSAKSFDNISWSTYFPYGEELPDNQQVENSYTTGNANMTGNVLLMHLNEQSANGGPGGYDVEDLSGNGYHGNESGGVSFNEDGRFNSSIGFDGTNDYLNLGDVLDMGSNDFTISAWVKRTVTGSVHRIVSKNWGSDGERSYETFVQNDDYVRFVVSETGNDNYFFASNDIIPSGKWYHVVAVKSGTNGYIYINGTLSNSTSDFPSSVFNNPNNFTIGVTTKTDGTKSGYFNGSIDEVAMWNRSLSADEIRDIYLRGALRLNLQTRTSDDNVDWSSWSSNHSNPSGLIDDSARYIQYRALFGSDDTDYSPQLEWVNISYSEEAIPPTYSRVLDNSSGSVTEGQDVHMSAYWDDAGSSLDTAILRTNKTGSYTNESYHDFSTKPEYSNFTFDTSGEVGETICWVIWSNDSVGNLNASMPQGVECFNVIASYGYLEVELADPPDPYTVARNSTFTLNATVMCRDGDCGNISGRARYNSSSANPDTDIPTSEAEPFYIMDNPNPQNCSGNPLGEDEYCQLTWSVNATGSVGASYEVGVMFESNYTGVSDNHTSNSTVQIVSCIIDITLQWDNVSFESMAPGERSNATENDNSFYNITVEATTTCNIDLYGRADDIERKNGGGYVIEAGNISYSNTTNDYSEGYNLSTGWVLFGESRPPGSNLTTYYWLDVPLSMMEGEYNSTLYIEGIEEGGSP